MLERPYARTVPVNEAVAARPTGPLRRFVREHHGYRQHGVEPARHLGMPSPYLTVIFTLHEPLHLAQHVDPAHPPGVYDAIVGGLHSSPAVVVHDGAQSGLQLEFSPLGARALFGMPAGELSGIDVEAVDVLGRVARDVQERVQEAADWTARFTALDEVLGSHVADERPPDEVCRAWSLLCRSGGAVPIRSLAREVGWSERHLTARFRTEIGLTPKLAARVIRFHRARRVLMRNVRAGRPNVAGVAAECGYFDQAHLVRDWQQFTGLAPTAWIDAEFRNFQVTAAYERAASSA
jgi:AraC-like DNA-binding protein